MRRPRIKPEHEPYPVSDTTVRIGGGVEGIASEITEPGGWLWSLIRAADGTASQDTIVRRVRRVHPKAPAAEVRAALNALIDGGHAEDAAAAVPADLTAAEQERYDRGMRWFRWADLTPRTSRWDVQRRLKAARVTLIGLGGTGGAAALALAGTGVGALHCVDADEVSLSNLNRQVLYTTADVGRPKAEAALDRLRLVNPDITITAGEQLIASAADLARASAGSSLLVLCADEPAELRLWANRVCLAARRPWVDSGYYGPLVTAGAYVPGHGPCWECLRAAERARLGLPETAPAGLVGELHRVPGHPATAITAGLSGQFAAHLAVALLTGVPPVAPGTVCGVNLMLAGQPVLIRAPRQPGCPACGQTGPKIPA